MTEELHILPIADRTEHVKTADCVCGPTLEEHRLGIAYIHHSLDGRETREQTERQKLTDIIASEAFAVDADGKAYFPAGVDLDGLVEAIIADGRKRTWFNSETQCEECDKPAKQVFDARDAGLFPLCLEHFEEACRNWLANG